MPLSPNPNPMGQALNNDIDTAPHRQQDLYFTELVELKIACEYMRRYRNSLSRRLTFISAFRGIASSGAIAAWAIVQAYPLVWGGIIAATQVADALKDVFPLTPRQQAANNLLMSLDALFIEALYEWEGVYSGRYDNEEIVERRRKLMQLRHDLDVKNFPTGDLPQRKDLMVLAENDAITYLESMFGQES
jgi:hypothetical protein